MSVPWVLDESQRVTPLFISSFPLPLSIKKKKEKVISQSREPTKTSRNDDANVARQKCSRKGLKQAQVWNGLSTLGLANFKSSNSTERKTRQRFDEGAP